MNDLISRQAAIDALIDDLSYYGSDDERAFGMSRAIGIVEKLPPAQPECKQECMPMYANVSDCISRQVAIDALIDNFGYINPMAFVETLSDLPSAQPQIVRCKDCKHNPKDTWFECPMSHLSEKQRPETAWCWKGERRTDEQT